MSYAPWFDELNTIYALRDPRVRNAPGLQTILAPLLDLIRDGRGKDLANMWLMRFAGSRFVAGNLDAVLEMANTAVETHDRTMPIWQPLRNQLGDEFL